MKITTRQLRKIIHEVIDVVNNDTGELFGFGPAGHKYTDAPEAAWPDLQKRLGITDINIDEEGWQYISGADFDKLSDEVLGKRTGRHRARERKRLDIDNLLVRVEQWAADAGSDYVADNPGIDMQDVARDLAASAKYSFEPDEWEELVWHFDKDLDYGYGVSDYGSGEDLLIDVIADSIVE